MWLNMDHCSVKLVPLLLIMLSAFPGTSLGCAVPSCYCDDYNAACINPTDMYSVPDTFALSLGQLHIQGATIYGLTFWDLVSYPTLWNLTIIYSQLEYIEPGTFSAIPGVIEIRLHNNLLSISDWMTEFQGLGYMTFCDLSFNKIQQLTPVNRYWVLFMSQGVHFIGNPLHCNCDLKWLFYFFDLMAAYQIPVSANCLTPAHLHDWQVIQLLPEVFKCSGPHLECTANVTVQICDQLYVECRAYGDPTPNMTITFPDGSQEESTIEYDPAGEFIAYGHLVSEVDPTTGFGIIQANAEGYEGSTSDAVSWTMEGNCGPCWEPCTTTTTYEPTSSAINETTTVPITTTTTSTQTDDVTTSAMDGTVVDSQVAGEPDTDDFPLVVALVSGSVGIAIGIIGALLALGLKHIVQKNKTGRTEPIVDGGSS